MTMNTRLTIATVITIVLLTGCQLPAASNTPISVPLQTGQPESLNHSVLKVLLDLAGIREEIKRLRNSIEEIQFETENAKRRQQDLFQNLESRVANIERNQHVLSGQPIDGLSQGNDQSVAQQNNLQNSGLVNQVVVSDSNRTLGNTDAVGNTAPTAPNSLSSDTTSIPKSSGQSLVLTQEQQAYDQAFELLKQSRYKDAITQFQQIVDTSPNSPLVGDAYYWMSEARYVNREFEYALKGFKTLVSQYPASQRVPEALLKIGYIEYDIGDYEKAANTFRDILIRFPNHQVALSAQTRLRRIEQTIQ